MTRETKIGLFVILALGVMMFMVLRSSDLSSMWKRGPKAQTVEIVMNDASGVRDGTPVRVAGVKVGTVEGIRLEAGKAIASISLEPSVVLREGAKAELRSQGVLGERYIALDVGSGEKATGAAIAATVPPSLDDITATISSIGADLKVVTENFKLATVNQSGENRISVIAANLETLTQTLVAMLEENRSNVRQTSEQFALLSGSLGKEIPLLIEQMTQLVTDLRAIAGGNSERIDVTMEHIAKMAENMDATSQSFSSIATKVDKGQGSIGKLINDPTTVDNLNEVLVETKNSLGEVKNLLGQANRLNFDLNFRSEYLLDPSATKSYLGVRITPNENKYYLIEAVVRGDKLLGSELFQTETFTYDADGNLLTRAVENRTEKEDELEITGQLAYRVGPVFLRGGLIEGEGGGGLEYFAFEDRMKFALESWDFGRQDRDPHAKIDLHLKFTKNLSLNFGWDDFLESDRNSAFLGGGLRWKDEDLKLLITRLGSSFL